MLELSLEQRCAMLFSPFTRDVQTMLFQHNRALKAVLIHGVATEGKKAVKSRKKYAEVVSEIDGVVKYLSQNLEGNLKKIGYLLENFTAEELKAMPNQKKEYRIFVSKVQKNLKRVKYQLNQHLHG